MQPYYRHDQVPPNAIAQPYPSYPTMPHPPPTVNGNGFNVAKTGGSPNLSITHPAQQNGHYQDYSQGIQPHGVGAPQAYDKYTARSPVGYTTSATAPATQAPRINTSAMPNVIAVQEEDQNRFADTGFTFNSTMNNETLPPLTTTNQVAVIDDGNASSRLMRLTTYFIPTSEDLAFSTKLPMSLLVQPFYIPQPRENNIPFIESFGKAGPLRCGRCRAYINLFARFVRSGRSFECNICSMVNDVPDEYYAPLDHSGRRMDLDLRPELSHGVVDFLASEEYYTRGRNPTTPGIIFAVDSSRSAIQNGSFFSALATLKKFVEDHKNGVYGIYQKVSIITFDKAIHLYDLRQGDPKVLVIPDVVEPFLPLSDGFFWDPVETYDRAIRLLDILPEMYSETRKVESCFGAVCRFSIDALKPCGGRVMIFSSSLPSVGTGLLKMRDGGNKPPSDKINPLVLPQGEFYENLGKEASTLGVSFSLTICPSTFVDLATIGKLSTYSGGRIFYYPHFHTELHGNHMMMNILTYILKPFVYDVTMRTRVSSNLQIGEYFGSLTSINNVDYQIAVLDCDQSFAVNFFHDGKLVDQEKIFFQCAILHTTCHGQRRIRVLNLVAKASNVLSNIFRMADVDAIVHCSIKRMVSQIATTPLTLLMQHFYLKTAQCLASYRKNCASNMPSGQLVLPESLKLLPLYCLAISKNSAFSPGKNSYFMPSYHAFYVDFKNIDETMAEIYDLLTLPLNILNIRLYPLIYPLHRTFEYEGAMAPQPIRLSQEFLESHGIYLLFNGKKMYFWIGSSVDPEVLTKIFGVAQVTHIYRTDSLPELQNILSIQIRNFISSLRNAYPTIYIPLQVIRQDIDSSEVDWKSMMIEDPHSVSGISYVDFLCRLHNQINHEMTSSSLAERTALLSFLQ